MTNLCCPPGQYYLLLKTPQAWPKSWLCQKYFHRKKTYGSQAVSPIVSDFPIPSHIKKNPVEVEVDISPRYHHPNCSINWYSYFIKHSPVQYDQTIGIEKGMHIPFSILVIISSTPQLFLTTQAIIMTSQDLHHTQYYAMFYFLQLSSWTMLKVKNRVIFVV